MGFFDFLKPKTHPVELTSENLKPSVDNSPLPVLVDFYSTSCGPCQQTARTVTKFATDFKNEVRVGMFNIENENSGKILRQYEIRSVPTLIFFINGAPVERFNGLTGYLKLKDALKKINNQKKNKS